MPLPPTIKQGILSEIVRKILLEHYSKFQMRLTTKDFTTGWKRLELRMVAGCTISLVLFFIVKEAILKATNQFTIVKKKKLKKFMNR